MRIVHGCISNWSMKWIQSKRKRKRSEQPMADAFQWASVARSSHLMPWNDFVSCCSWCNCCWYYSDISDIHNYFQLWDNTYHHIRHRWLSRCSSRRNNHNCYVWFGIFFALYWHLCWLIFDCVFVLRGSQWSCFFCYQSDSTDFCNYFHSQVSNYDDIRRRLRKPSYSRPNAHNNYVWFCTFLQYFYILGRPEH